MVFARLAAVIAWLAGSLALGGLVDNPWVGVPLFIATGLAAGWFAGSWWAALLPPLAGIVLAIVYAPGVHDNELTPQIAVAFIAVFVVPTLELVLLAGVGAHKLWRWVHG